MCQVRRWNWSVVLMGASAFYTIAKADTAEAAFHIAKQEAYWDFGHAGYTGTIAEKPGFIVAWDYKHEQPHALASFVGDDGDAMIYALHAVADIRPTTLDDFKNEYDAGNKRWCESGLPWEQKGYTSLAALLSIVPARTVEHWYKTFWSKWDEALCVPLANGSFLFCGYASS